MQFLKVFLSYYTKRDCRQNYEIFALPPPVSFQSAQTCAMERSNKEFWLALRFKAKFCFKVYFTISLLFNIYFSYKEFDNSYS